MHDECDDIDSAGLARVRWLLIVEALLDALGNLDSEDRERLSAQLEIELGLRPVVAVAGEDSRALAVEQWVTVLNRYGDAHEELLPVLVPRLERALATQPKRWIAYVKSMGRSCFDPAELSGCAAIAKKHVDGPLDPVLAELIKLLHWSWDCLFGQRPVPWVREVPRRGHPTIMLEIIGAVERIELNWESLGLTPVVNHETVVRWDAHERWTVWIKLMRARTGKITSTAALRVRSDGVWRIVRPPQ